MDRRNKDKTRKKVRRQQGGRKQKNAKIGQSGGGGVGRMYRSVPDKAPQRRLYIPVGICVFMLISAIALLSASLSKTPTECDLFRKFQSTRKVEDRIDLAPLTITQCLEQNCDFDATKCSSPCPFGYEYDNETDCTISCECAFEGIFQGDVQFEPDGIEQMLKDYGYLEVEFEFQLYFGWKHQIWNNIEVDGRFKVPYEISNTITQEDYENIWEVTIRNVSKRSCIDLVPREDERDYMYISLLANKCSTHIGRIGGKMLINLALGGCFFEPTIQHELMHAFGFAHEQSRPDRDAYVTILWENIIEGSKYQFEKTKLSSVKDLHSQYETYSGMHYDSTAFQTNGPTMTVKPDGKILTREPRDHFQSDEDFRELSTLYECKEPGPTKVGEWNDWQTWSDCSESCGEGSAIRYRACIYKRTGEKLTTGCPGVSAAKKECNTMECPPKTGEWEEWSGWGKCGSTCGKARHMRSRACKEVNACKGSYYGYKDCYLTFCDTGEPVTTDKYGTWKEWGNWNNCNATCNSGVHSRFRQCYRKNDQLTTNHCVHLPEEGPISRSLQVSYKPCEAIKCELVPSRYFSTPAPPTLPTAAPVTTESTTTTTATTTTTTTPTTTTTTKPTTVAGTTSEPTTVGMTTTTLATTAMVTTTTMATTTKGQAQWEEWGTWEECDLTCGEGTRKRTRQCPGGLCDGDPSESEACNIEKCPSKGLFSEKGLELFNFCIYGTLYTGKFNSDAYEDIMCLYQDGFARIFLSDPVTLISGDVSWEGQTGICQFASGEDEMRIFVRDLDGDGVDDLACHNQITKEIEVTLNQGGRFSGSVHWRGEREHCRQVANIEDVNGDGKHDLICGDENNVFKHLYKNTQE